VKTIRFKGTTQLHWKEKVSPSFPSSWTLCRVVDDRTSEFLFLQLDSIPPETPTYQDDSIRDGLTAISRDSGYTKCYRCHALGHVQADCPTLDLGGAGTTTDRDDLIRDNITTMSRDSGYASGISRKVVDHGHHNLNVPSDIQLAMPAPLIGKSDLDMVKLASSISCQFCGKTGPLNDGASLDQWHPGPGENESVPIWAFNINSCGGCLESRCIKEIDIILSSSIPSPLMVALPYVFLTNELHVISAITLCTEKPPGEIQITKRFLLRHVEEIQQKFIKARAMGSVAAEEWLKGLDERGKVRRNDTVRWERWQASGGLARLRALQNVEARPVQKRSSISDYDLQSVVSVQS
jgi:hypothetical protein